MPDFADQIERLSLTVQERIEFLKEDNSASFDNVVSALAAKGQVFDDQTVGRILNLFKAHSVLESGREFVYNEAIKRIDEFERDFGFVLSRDAFFNLSITALEEFSKLAGNANKADINTPTSGLNPLTEWNRLLTVHLKHVMVLVAAEKPELLVNPGQFFEKIFEEKFLKEVFAATDPAGTAPAGKSSNAVSLTESLLRKLDCTQFLDSFIYSSGYMAWMPANAKTRSDLSTQNIFRDLREVLKVKGDAQSLKARTGLKEKKANNPPKKVAAAHPELATETLPKRPAAEKVPTQKKPHVTIVKRQKLDAESLTKKQSDALSVLGDKVAEFFEGHRFEINPEKYAWRRDYEKDEAYRAIHRRMDSAFDRIESRMKSSHSEDFSFADWFKEQILADKKSDEFRFVVAYLAMREKYQGFLLELIPDSGYLRRCLTGTLKKLR